MKIGVIGCGNMGGGMVAQLLAAGMDVVCFDPDVETRQRMLAVGARTEETVTELVRDRKFVILSLPKAQIVEEVMGEVCTHIESGTIVLDTSTSTPATSQAMAALGQTHGFEFIDGPVSGGPAAAKAGTMTMLLAGSQTAIECLRPITDILTAKTVMVGASGAGHAAKIANNMLCAANLVLVSEALRLCEAVGVAPEGLLKGVNAGSGRSGVSEVNFPKWVLNGAFDSGFTMGLMRKDVGLALDLAGKTGVNLEGFAGIADLWLNQSGDIPDTADFNEITKYGAVS
ncbi:NAD(P)-dependent oxidoreductase [Sedimentitalea sp. CY04]|uniref:NAD(P)-dependent oxidoreductase n=1 Tax=Parasedimentitalea denitrificans TaxID=2211118 RepID=A0ABX0WA44_9RHOB|nr:NAD(P)-dependent oxidoreductase [Sedimentitalea sp. CY04]NIZ61669.1 NAD(P)-dependent oxidoreductase [Sedimentitalea sp. CY04]